MSVTDRTLKTSRLSYLLLAFFLVMTAVLSLVWSHARLMEQDEFLSFYTDSVATFHKVVLAQLRYPISLDPPTYHLLSHLSMDLIGANAIALRLPALAGFLLLEVCLFFFVRRIAGDRSAVVAMAVPLLTASFRYSVEGRPYGLLLGMYALSLVCWQRATLDDGATRSRRLSLFGLWLAIALAITSHYFGVLILIPVSLGELARIVDRKQQGKRFDFGVVAALALGLATVGVILPFKHALMAYRVHYYVTDVNLHDISQGYRELFLRYALWPMMLQRAAAVVMVVMALALAVAGYRRFKRRPESEHASLWVALCAMALLPVFGYLFGRFVTHTMEVRYVIAALIAFAAVFGIVLERRLRGNVFYAATLAIIFLAALDVNVHNIANERRDSNEILASFELSPEAAAAIHGDPRRPIYVQTLNDFFLDTYYDPELSLRRRFSLVYGQNEEIHWLDHDTNTVTARNMMRFTPLSVTSFAEFSRQPDALLVLNPSGWLWIDQQLAAQHTPETNLGEALRGQLVRVHNGE